ncbi:amino acid permease [Erythrobacter sp. sf7]|uniref:Amino acid permease n=1 Tax=Erythrobacter fulvus TaxID=2987523 RepID=A0ABT5JSZ7_9SPHN|nr:amino acid permease [Erythrobacter fulvus]MDC8755734.1 amino acid permease [Erythrobacter fulvus]
MSTSVPTGQLQKRLGLPFAIAVCVGTVIGTGIMRAPGEIANMVPDPTIVLVLWLVGGFYVLLSCNVAAEISSAIPRSGGHYIPVHEGLGNSMGLLVGWTMWSAFVVVNAALSIAAADFLGTILPFVADNAQWSALAILLLMTALNWFGVEEGRWVQIVGTALKIGLLLAVVVAALLFPLERGAETAVAQSVPPAEPISLFTILLGLQFIVAVYDGWYTSIYFAGEDKNPGRNIPRSLFQAAVAVMAIYLLVNWSLISALDFDVLRSSQLPMAVVIGQVAGEWGGVFVALLATLMALITLNGCIMSTPRVLYGLAEDGLFLKSALQVNRGGTPTVALAVGTLFSIPLIFTGGYVFAFRLMGAMTLFAACLYILSHFSLRIRRPDMGQPYRARGHPILPALVLMINLALLISFVIAEPISGAIMAGMIAICIPVGVHLEREKRRLAPTTT